MLDSGQSLQKVSNRHLLRWESRRFGKPCYFDKSMANPKSTNQAGHNNKNMKTIENENNTDFAVPSANPPVRESATHPDLPLESTPVQPYLTNPYFSICRWYLTRPILMSTTHTSPFAAGI